MHEPSHNGAKFDCYPILSNALKAKLVEGGPYKGELRIEY